MRKIFLAQAELDALPEYSASLPTDLTTGKLWKRKCSDCADGWAIGKVVLQSKVGIQWYEAVIVGIDHEAQSN